MPFTDAQNPFFNIVNITAQGLQYTIPGCCYGGNNSTGAVVVSDGTLLYTGSGEVWNPTTQTQVGSFPVTVYNNAANIVMDTSSGHLFAIGDENFANSTSVVLSAYGKKSLALTGALAFPQVTSPIDENLIRWGTDGFAFISQDLAPPFVQSVYLLTSSLAKSATSNPVPRIVSIAPSSASQNALGFQLILNGAGFTESSVVTGSQLLGLDRV